MTQEQLNIQISVKWLPCYLGHQSSIEMVEKDVIMIKRNQEMITEIPRSKQMLRFKLWTSSNFPPLNWIYSKLWSVITEKIDQWKVTKLWGGTAGWLKNNYKAIFI